MADIGEMGGIGFDHPLKMYDLTEELIRRGYSDANIRAVLAAIFNDFSPRPGG